MHDIARDASVDGVSELDKMVAVTHNEEAMNFTALVGPAKRLVPESTMECISSGIDFRVQKDLPVRRLRGLKQSCIHIPLRAPSGLTTRGRGSPSELSRVHSRHAHRLSSQKLTAGTSTSSDIRRQPEGGGTHCHYDAQKNIIASLFNRVPRHP